MGKAVRKISIQGVDKLLKVVALFGGHRDEVVENLVVAPVVELRSQRTQRLCGEFCGIAGFRLRWTCTRSRTRNKREQRKAGFWRPYDGLLELCNSCGLECGLL
jgi:hypothetical protein